MQATVTNTHGAREESALVTKENPHTDYTTLHVEVSDGVAWVTLAHPPLNLLDSELVPELKRFVREVRSDEAVRVVVLQSNVADFFAAHVDAGYMLDAEGFMRLGAADGPTSLNPMQHLVHSVRTLPQVTIAKLRGRLRGGGNELAMAADMRFAAAGRTFLSQLETRLGIIPGGGGTQLLAHLVGRARALEIILGGDLFDAETAERYGWVNRTLPDHELDAFVDSLARRVAALSPAQIRAAKAAVDGALGVDLEALLKHEGQVLGLVYPAPDAVVDRTRRALSGGLQTREQELDLEGALDTYR
ncbi:Enoyl-CoA hydratase [Minicystis rosea]|nr:Enoyl-CoA hydratase [Minicystis rosea]